MKTMKKKFLYPILFITSFGWMSCEKNNFSEGILSPITSIEDVRELYINTDVLLDKDKLMGAEKITGIVISNPDSANVPTGMVVLQNTNRSRTRGIILALDNAASYKPGDSLLVNISGKTLTKVNGSLQITGLTESAVEKVAANRRVNVQVTSSLNINQKPGNFESTLVQIKSGTINPVPLPTDVFEGDKSVVNGADSVILHTEAAASFANATLPANATFTGIIFLKEQSSNSVQIQLWPRSIDDITDQVAAPDPNGPQLGKFPVIITGFVNDAKGGDGNYEYFQFKATRDIDFEKNPISVVTCFNANATTPYQGAAPGGGWATGGGRTYKFNITSGTITKGEFFYVGGSSKRINGANSTNISAAKWLASINYVNNAGDGFGSPSTGLLPNSGNAAGIAVFEGINVTETSVPLDVVFFGGTGKATIFNETLGHGYRIVDNDHYSTIEAATATAQPFFFQGTNQYIIPHSLPSDAGYFVKLGGVFDTATKSWTTARTHTFYLMTPTSEITEIESENVTTLTN